MSSEKILISRLQWLLRIYYQWVAINTYFKLFWSSRQVPLNEVCSIPADTFVGTPRRKQLLCDRKEFRQASSIVLQHRVIRGAHHALGLLKAHKANNTAALNELAEAAKLAPANACYAYIRFGTILCREIRERWQY